MHMRIVFAIAICFCLASPAAHAGDVTTTWGGDVGITYDTGFAHNLMRSPGGGVQLFNIELIENDAPGAGLSEKGESTDTIWGSVRARKILDLDDSRAHGAWLVIYVQQQGDHPLLFSVNGHDTQVDNWDMSKCREPYRWTEFPAEWLTTGSNTIELSSPEARTEDEGWILYIARADEFPDGGGDPADVGKTSFRSDDGGESWRESPFGPLGQTRAEYTVRASLDRHVAEGWLATPVIDLWRGDSDMPVVPLREIRSLALTARAETPRGSSVKYYLRRGRSAGPFDAGWEEYRLIGEGSRLDYEIGGAELNVRYVQIRIELATDNPLTSPSITELRAEAGMFERVPPHDNIHILEVENPPIRYSSIDWQWETADRPEFEELRKLENLDEVIAGSRTQFNAQVQLLDYVTKRWRHSSPLPGYPGWDAVSILDRVASSGGGGMCIQFNNTLGGLCMAYGWQARLVNSVGHEVCEVWNDDYGKWIFLDADLVNTYNYDAATCEPLNMHDLHGHYLDYYFPGRSVDWMNDMVSWYTVREDDPPPVRRGSLTYHEENPLTGFINAAFMRMVPRNNWYDMPTPRPLTHGITWWPWDGYINWFDERTPPKRQYSWYTDRPRDMWPDLNKVHVDAVSGFGNDRLFLRFETYTPNFSHFEINVDDTGWKEVGERWTWLLQSGRNDVRVRAVNKLGAKGYPSRIELNHANARLGD
jgi:hypothetical protein